MIKNSYTKIKNWFIVYGIAFILTILAFMYFTVFGYPYVNTSTKTLPFKTPPIYMIPIFFPFGMLLGEIIQKKLEKKDQTFNILFFIEVIGIGSISFLRFLSGIPFSGHAIIIGFFLLHEILDDKIKYPIRIFIGIIILIITIFFKVFMWNDIITLLFGFLVGIILWTPGFIHNYKSQLRLR